MSASAPPAPGPFGLRSETLGALVVVDHFLERLGVDGLLEAFVAHDDRRVKLAPAKALGVVVRNLVVAHSPVYALGEWAAPHDVTLLGLEAGEAALCNDDRVGRCLSRLFDADRASLLNRLVLDAVREFDIDCSQMHNDSTSVSFAGSYASATGTVRANKPTPAIVHGHSKDHRPDLKQLVWILTVAADGAVPVACRVADGNTSDDTTHIATWDALVGLLGRADFLYVADCKLASRTNMDHIAKRGGRFISVLPATRKEDQTFRAHLIDHEPDWTDAARRPARRKADPDDRWWTTEAPWPSTEGYRIVWAKSSAKVERDAESRRARIAKAIAALDELNQKIISIKTRMKTAVAVEVAARATLEKSGGARWVRFEVEEHTEERFRQETRGRPGHNTRYRRLTRPRHRLRFEVREDVVAADACSDGCFPLVTCDRQLSGAEVLAAYKHQPNLERRHAQLKGTQLVAPVFLKDPARIEGLLCCHFIALVVQALIEREIRAAMAARGLEELSLYPEDRACPSPSAARVLEIFNGVARHHLLDEHGAVVQTFHPELTTLQLQVLDLLAIPAERYQ